MNNRIEYIDIAKGISITLVVLFHNKIRMLYPEIIDSMSLFRLPLFFFLSGVFLSYLRDPKTFFSKKAEALLKPYFSVLFVLFIFEWLQGEPALALKFNGIFYGNGDTIQWTPMWFLTHLFALYGFSYLLYRYGSFYKYPLTIRWACVVLFLTIGIYCIDILWLINVTVFDQAFELPGLPFSLDIILVTSAFFIAGNLLKEPITNFTPRKSLFSLALFSLVLITVFTDTHIDLNKRVFTNPLLATVGAACGIYIVLHLSFWLTKFGKVSKVFNIFGTSSLYILIFHSWISDKSYLLLSSVSNDLIGPLSLSIVSLFVGILTPLLLKAVIERSSLLSLFFLPFKSNKLLQRMSHARHGTEHYLDLRY